MSNASVLGLRVMLAYAGTRGVDVPALLAEVGVSRAALDDPRHRGFEDASGFRRAYRRWTGKSPSRGRR